MSRKMVCLYFIVVSFYLPALAFAADVASSDTTESKDWAIVLQDATRYLQSEGKTQALTQGYISLVRQIRSRAYDNKTRFQQELDQSEKLLKAIGPPPAKDGPAEATEIAGKREQYNRQITAARARIAEADLAIVRAAGLEETFSRLRFERLLEEVHRRTPIPVSPGVLIKGVPEIAAEVRRILYSPLGWLAILPPDVGVQTALLPGVLVLILGAFLGWGIRRSVSSTFGEDPGITDPSYARRFGFAIVEVIGNIILPVAVLAALYLWLTRPGALVSGLFADALTSFLLAMLFFCTVVSFARSFLSPEQPAWRLTGQSSEHAQRAHRLILMLAVVFSIDMFFSDIWGDRAVSAEALSIYSAVFGSLEGWFFLKLGREELWRSEAAQEGATQEGGQAWRLIRHTSRVFAVIGIAALFVGYGALGKRLLTNLIWTGLLLWMVVMLRGFIHELVSLATKSESHPREAPHSPPREREAHLLGASHCRSCRISLRHPHYRARLGSASG